MSWVGGRRHELDLRIVLRLLGHAKVYGDVISCGTPSGCSQTKYLGSDDDLCRLRV